MSKKLLLLVLGIFAFTSNLRAEVPHYFPAGVEKNTTALQIASLYQNYNAMGRCTEPLQDFPLITVPATQYKAVVIDGKSVKFIFHPYTKTSDGKIIFTNFCGSVEITPAQYEFAANDFIAEATRAMGYDYEYFKDYEKLAVKARAKAMGVTEEELRKQLPLKISAKSNVTYRQRDQLPPEPKKTDFIPKVVHISYFKALGITWLNSDEAYTSLESRMVDYVSGYPKVMMHEFVHANSNLQNVVLNSGIDLELMASLPEMLWPDDKVDLFFHGYVRDVRDIIRVYYGFDFDQAREEIIPKNLEGELRVNIPKLIEYQAKLESVKKELHAFFRDVVVPEFYSNPVYWTSQHNKLKDDRGVFHVMMALHYDPTLLDGHGPTMAKIQAHQSDIERWAKEAYRKSGTGGGDEGDIDLMPFSRKFINQIQAMTGITNDKALELANKYHITMADVKGKSPHELITLALEVLRLESKSRKEAVR